MAGFLAQERPARTTTALTGALAVVVLGAGVASLVGWPSWIIVLAAMLPYALLAWNRLGGVLAVASLVTAQLLALLAILVVTAVVRAPMLATTEIVYTVLGVAGCGLVYRHSNASPLRRVSRSALRLGVPALAGTAVWVCAVVASRFVPGGSQLAWVMRGDAANNILLVRDLLREHGVAIGAGSNPVPLPTVVLAVITASGRGSIDPQGFLQHDVQALAFTWMCLIGFGCFVAGLTAGVIARSCGAGRMMTVLASGGASLIPLSWFLSGYPIDFGFLDAEFAIPLVLLCVLACMAGSRRPEASIAILLALATLLLTVWSPLVLIPGLLAVVVARRTWRGLLRGRSVARWLAYASAAQLLFFGLAVTLPSVLSLGHLLAAAGFIYGFHRSMVLVLAIIVLALAVATRTKSSGPVLLCVSAVVVASGIALGILLFISRDQPSIWTYYPVKLAWLASATFLILIVGLVAGLISKLAANGAVRLVLAGVAAILVAVFLVWAPTAVPGYVAASAVSQVVKGRALGPGDVVADRILRLADPRRPTILWHSGDPFESTINFWILEMWANTLQGKTALRTAAYGIYGHSTTKQLCRILGLMGTGAVVYSDQAGLQSAVDATCPAIKATVSPEPGR
jgi:hypothetical protein